MGVVCSKKSVAEGDWALQPDGRIDEEQPRLYPSEIFLNQSPLYKMISKSPAFGGALGTEGIHIDGPLSTVHEDQPESGDAEENGDKNKIARAISERAKSARSRTTVVARKGAAKVNEVGSLLGRAGTVGIGKAVEALDNLGSSMTSLKIGSGFSSKAASKGNRIEIRAFEVANTIAKGYKLRQSLSKESIDMLREDILCSEGVQRLVSTDMAELLSIAAADKRNELMTFAAEVVRFGNHCRDPQWHYLNRWFEKLDTEAASPRQSEEEAEEGLNILVTLAQHTAELYHELNSLERFESETRRKFQDEELYNNASGGDSLAILRNELRSQRRHVKNLQKKSLWSKTLEEVMEKLVDTVYFLHQEIQNAFGDTGEQSFKRQDSSRKRGSKRLGSLGLALHYAGIISQIDGLVSRPGSVPMNTRDTLYQGLPPSIKGPLRLRLSRFRMKEENTVPLIKAEMEKTLSWLVPIATNTTKAHHGFGWVGEWASAGSTMDIRLSGQTQFPFIQTLHHADQKATDECLLELFVLLQKLIILARTNAPGIKTPLQSPFHLKSPLKEEKSGVTETPQPAVTQELTPEDQDMLKHVNNRKLTPGISKSQEFDKKERIYKSLMKSSSHSPRSSMANDSSRVINHVHLVPIIDFDADKIKALDVIDRVDSI